MKRSFIFLMVLLLMFGGCAENRGVKKSEYALDESDFVMGTGILDTSIAINGKVISFPLEYEDFTKTGYTPVSSEKHTVLQKNTFAAYPVESGNTKIYIFFANLDETEKELSDCIVCGAECFAEDDFTALLPQNITVGVSDYKSVVSAYGNSFSQEDPNGYEKCIKYGNENNAAYLYFSEDILQKATLYNVADPEKFAVSAEVPQIVKEYKAPSGLSDKLSDFIFYLYGHTYTMPLPVSVLLADGWINVGTSCEYVGAGKTVEKAIKLTNQNRTVEFDVKNLANYPTTVENCFIVSVTSTSDVKLDLTLSNGCRVGTYASNLESTFGKKNFTDIKKDGDNTVYVYSCANGTFKITANNGSGFITEIKVELPQ